MTDKWEVLAIKRDGRSGEVTGTIPYTWLQPMPELNARKMAWACDVWAHLQVRVRPVGDTSIGEPHNWKAHAPK